MSLRRPRPPLTRRLPIALAAGALAVATAVTPALAADDPGQGNQNNQNNQSGQSNQGNSQSGQGNWSQQGGNGNNTGSGNSTGSNQQGNNNAQQSGGIQSGGDWGDQAGGNHGDQGQYRGVVTAQKLALRSAPNRGSQVIRYAHKGEVVSIFCKVPGDKVDGNPLWYLLTDGTWAWGPARHIDNIGPAPRWC
ncbi:SH3 domain-containing protein [Streptomyces sp. I4(2020)]|uniref:SH3 domain-containing protein n=1 Tax=Streptomyces sp. I4(2020) TaxID=2760981 RepID=UPI0018EE8FAC|nr:SH3 domain-containing protein [Streptomyces sp. I4(2020)]MBJ6614774.1 SH3 domain-containing protein [Streptomyces sp. I3(2020)]MBJ6625114.1 SH3 domain-containing protein [Streptomyces sp. I4(2020)]